MRDLIHIWKNGRAAVPTGFSPEELIHTAKTKNRTVLYSHYGTILILSLSLVGIGLFLLSIPFAKMLSRAGVWMMIGGLSLRILIEVVSVLKFRAVKITSDTQQATQAFISFFAFRQKIHGPITLSIVLLYIVGFYLLTPEFNIHISLFYMVLMHLSFVIGAIFLIWVIRKGIRKETESLEYLTSIGEQFS